MCHWLAAMLLWYLPLSAVAAPAVAPASPAVGVHIAPVDVLANVRHMLERARRRQQQSPSPSATGPKPSIPSAAAEPGRRSAPIPPVPPSASQRTVRVSKPATPSSDTPVQLPDKVITIRDLKDLRGLANELEKAKQRQRQGAKP